ncbi:MAG: zinc ABC transporter substrate-binding protein [Rubrobacter sp.]|nr:zinc ABC transporter substrate-binding protein [Rubrobacter sp.]
MDLRLFLKVSLAGVLAAALAVGCGGDSEEGSGEALAEGQPVQVTATTTMITDLVEQVGGDEVEVTGLMGPGVDPHTYRASQGDVQALQEADAVFYNGLFLEGQMQDLFIDTAEQNPTVQVTEAVPEEQLLESEDYEDQFDPHVWFDVEMWQTTVDPVVKQLSELRPDAEEDFQQRGEEYRQELEELHSEVEEEISSIPEEDRVMVTAHDAFRYFGEQYGMQVEGIEGISTEGEAGSGDIQEVADLVVENEVPAIFVEGSVPPQNIEAVQAAAQDRGWDVQIADEELYSDAGGEEGSGAETYEGMVRANIETIRGALT